MENKFFDSLTKQQLNVLEPLIYNTLHVKMNKKDFYGFIFDLINKGSNLRFTDKFLDGNFSDDFVRDMAKKLIVASNLDVNVSYGPEEQDLMFYTMLYGDVKDVQMLIDAGYNGTNLIKKCTVKCYFPEKYPYSVDMDKKYKLLKSMPELDLASEFAKQRKSQKVKYLEILDKNNKLKSYEDLENGYIELNYETLQEMNKEIPQFRKFIEACNVMTYDKEKALNNIRKEMIAVTNSPKVVDSILAGKKTELTDKVVKSFLKRVDYKYNKGINSNLELSR